VAAALEELREGWGPAAERLPPGETLRLTLREVDRGVVLVVEGGEGPGRPEALLEAVPGLVAVWSSEEGGPRLLAGADDTRVTWAGETVPVRAGAFLQVNRPAAVSLRSAVLGLLRPADGVRIVEAYAGLGSVGRALAGEGAEVTAIEVDPEAVAGARRMAPPGYRVLEGAVEERLAEALPAERVVVNPPRTGLHERVPEVLRDALPRRLVYVSCDPATLARDRKRLAPTFELTSLRAWDLFPQTAHVEAVAVFAPPGDAGTADGAGDGPADGEGSGP